MAAQVAVLSTPQGEQMAMSLAGPTGTRLSWLTIHNTECCVAINACMQLLCSWGCVACVWHEPLTGAQACMHVDAVHWRGWGSLTA
jgi:hypothetical protein